MIHVNLFFSFFLFFTFHEVFWWIGARGYSCLFGFYGCAFYMCLLLCIYSYSFTRKEKERKARCLLTRLDSKLQVPTVFTLAFRSPHASEDFYMSIHTYSGKITFVHSAHMHTRQ